MIVKKGCFGISVPSRMDNGRAHHKYHRLKISDLDTGGMIKSMKKLFAAITILLLLICTSASSYDTPALSSSLAKDADTVYAFFHGQGDKGKASSSFDRLYELLYEDAETYILNTSKGKFHYPTCSGVKQMKEENKTEVFCSRNLLLSIGYSPCGTCRP